jgi:hypothetical protein
MNELLKKIRSRGYWKVIIHPASFLEKRVANISDLYPLLQKNSVQFRGWDFPHLDSGEEPRFDIDWIEQGSEWEQYLEWWRFYQSGQFNDFMGMDEDWLDQSSLSPRSKDWKPGEFLSVTNALFQFSEIFEFAARIALSKAGDEQMHLEITLSGLKNRSLWADPSRIAGSSLLRTKKASVKELPYKADLTRIQLVTEPRELALKAAVELFRRFGWDASLDALRDMQDELLRKRVTS